MDCGGGAPAGGISRTPLSAPSRRAVAMERRGAAAIVYFLAPMLLAHVAAMARHTDYRTVAITTTDDNQMEHPLGRVLLESHNGPVLLLCVLLAVVIAPITEETPVPLALARMAGIARTASSPTHLASCGRFAAGVVPMGLASLLFAAMHIRGPENPSMFPRLSFGWA